MKKFALVLVLCLAFIMLTGCGENSNGSGGDVTSSRSGSDTDEPAVEIDIDLTKMSITMASAQYENILSDVPSYYGQIVKLKGLFFPYESELDEELYLFALLDCPSGCWKYFGFKSYNLSYPDDFPPPETVIELTGEVSSFEVEGNVYPCLIVDEIIIV
jgi:predicted small secreted protein